jgi:hypothetical protein
MESLPPHRRIAVTPNGGGVFTISGIPAGDRVCLQPLLHLRAIVKLRWK